MRSGSIVDEAGRLNNFAVEPQIYLQEKPTFGFTPQAEKLNGRLAMIGFVSLLALEVLTGNGILGNLTSF